MSKCKINTITAIISVLIAMMAFLAIYKDITSSYVPQGIFVCMKGVFYI